MTKRSYSKWDGATVEERFWAKVNKRGRMLSLQLGPCWEWTAAATRGYGRFDVGSRTGRAPRLAWELFHGPIPEGLAIDHLCRNPPCVNPAHLEPVTNRENVLRGTGITARCARKTHCPHGHPYDEANTYVNRQGARECRECHRAKLRHRRAAVSTPRKTPP